MSESKSPSKSPAPSEVKDVVNEHEKKKQTFIVRTIWTLIMTFLLIVTLCSGQFWTILAVLLLQISVFKECIGITVQKAKDQDLKHTGLLNWWFLMTTVFYLEGRYLIKYFLSNFMVSEYTSAVAIRLVIHHKFICYLLYVTGFVGFVASLRKGTLMFQFSQLCITHMTLLLVILQGHCIVNNIFNGMFWFIVPAGLVVINDIFAYLCGITFGKTQLISISPKKTVEGFVGAWICTMFASFLLTYIFCNVNYFICPVTDNIYSNCFSNIECTPSPVFIHQIYKLPSFLTEILHKDYIQVKPVYFHTMMISIFASLIAPFGGFFASGLKRAFKIKDFGDTIPGHGGITDRMDCQFMMGSFSYLYYETFISTHNMDVGKILQSIIINLTAPEISVLVRSLVSYLYKNGSLEEKSYETIMSLI
ncbi:phosphatidate cytidylyltransferase [Martiniozyma asiatica (nom. inval.)]|nr:phosphatidate cytidylyltransferase [Martiniozyma asiatica]